MKKSWVIAVFIIALIFTIEYLPLCFAVDASQASKAISQAEQDLNGAYINVSEADRAGADVSLLLDRLNSAGAYLSNADSLFKAGNYEDAVTLATECSYTVRGVADEAETLKSYAQGIHSNIIFWSFFVSIVGLISVIVLGFWGWGFLKRRYSRELLNRRPEVVDL